MTDDEWDTFAMLLDKGFKWKEPFGPAHEATYRTLLDGYSSEQIATVLRALVARGQVFGPTPGEIVAEIRRDPSRPTFDEAWRVVRLVLSARTSVRKSRWELGERDRLDEVAQLERAGEPDIHPLVAEFIVRQGGPARLRALALDDPENSFREARRRELRVRWDEHCEASEGREIAALARGRRGELGAFDPLAAIGRPVAQIESGSGSW